MPVSVLVWCYVKIGRFAYSAKFTDGIESGFLNDITNIKLDKKNCSQVQSSPVCG